MARIDLRQSLNAISDVVNNRPHALRQFDQIYMKAADLLLQAEHVSSWFDEKRVVFMGDGDALALCLVHLRRLELLERGPQSVHVLDFDERVIASIKNFATHFEIADYVTAELYNVADPLPQRHWQEFDGFYTNPPFGASNGGASVRAFVNRGFEAVGENGVGCVVVADHRESTWTQEVLQTVQRFILDNDFIISEIVPEFHRYHLDDTPGLTSCSVIIRRLDYTKSKYASKSLDIEALADFYGEESPLETRYVRDLTNGGKLKSNDYRLESLG